MELTQEYDNENFEPIINILGTLVEYCPKISPYIWNFYPLLIYSVIDLNNNQIKEGSEIFYRISSILILYITKDSLFLCKVLEGYNKNTLTLTIEFIYSLVNIFQKNNRELDCISAIKIII